MLGDAALVYVALTVGAVCLLAAAVCACAALLDHFLSAVARGSFLLPVSTYFRSAAEFLTSESRHLSAASRSAVEQHYELTSLQQIIAVFNKGLQLTTSLRFSLNVSFHTKLYSPITVETQNTTMLNKEIKYDS